MMPTVFEHPKIAIDNILFAARGAFNFKVGVVMTYTHHNHYWQLILKDVTHGEVLDCWDIKDRRTFLEAKEDIINL